MWTWKRSPFSTEEAAIAAARQAATDNARRADDVDWEAGLNHSMCQSGWVAYYPYGPEGDCVRVVKRQMDRED